MPTPKRKAPTKKKAPSKKKSSSAATKGAPAVPPLTRIEAHVDVGFGNKLYIRGEGASLNWDKGTSMKCESANCWSWTTRKAPKRGITYKLILNDETWAHGEDHSVEAGSISVSSPTF